MSPAPTSPHARTRSGVATLVGLHEDPTNSVLCAGRIAVDRDMPLELVMTHVGDDDRSQCMALVDGALSTARTAFPRLEVRVHLEAGDLLDWAAGYDRPPDLVVLNARQAQQRLPECQVVVV